MAYLATDPPPDYYARARALWPRLEHPRSARVRHDPHRLATLISRRTTLSVESILALIGAGDSERPASGRAF